LRHGCKTVWGRAALRALLFPALVPNAQAAALQISAGYGQDIDVYAVNLQLDRLAPIHQFEAWALTGHLELGVGQFQGHHSSSSNPTTRAVAALAKLRWQRRAFSALAPFVEFGLGGAHFSNSVLGDNRELGGTFEFTEVLRTGCRFGDRERFEIAIYGQHFSNAGLQRVNDGLTYAAMSFAWYFR
jgi:lipid A 3-O-deacylase